jgi:predicted peptidase
MHTQPHRSMACLTVLAVFTGLLAVPGSAPAQDAAQAKTDGTDAFEALVYTDGEGGELPYRLIVPPQAEGPRPVLLFLHGAGERGDDNRRQLIHGKDLLLKAARDFGCIVVAPQCPAGEKWSVVDWTQDKVTFSDEPSEPMRLTLLLLDDLAKRYDVDTDRLYIMGLSMGGYGTWDAICREPGRFAAAAPICGGGDPAQASLLVRTPVWAFHGDADPVVSVDLTRAMVQAIKDAGGEPKYTEYPGVGHNSWTPAFAEPELLPWLTAQSLDDDAAQTQPDR